MNRTVLTALAGFLVLAAGSLTLVALTASAPEVQATVQVDTVLVPIRHPAPDLPATPTLCGEPVPMDAFGVRESLDREMVVNAYHHSSTILYLKRAGRWFPIIEPILAEEGIPDDMKYLAVIESGLAQVVSPAGASGFWQFMKRTAPSYGLEVNGEVDERYHVAASTRAACAYLLEAHERLGSWSLPQRLTTWAWPGWKGSWKTKAWSRIGTCI